MQLFHPSRTRTLARYLVLISSMLLLAGCFERADWSPNSRYAAKAEKRHLYIYDVKKKTSAPIFTESRKDYRIGHVRFLDNDTVLVLRYQSLKDKWSRKGEPEGKKPRPIPTPMDLTAIDRRTGKATDLATIKALTGMPQFWAGFTIAPDGGSVVFVESPGKNEVRLKRLDMDTGKVTDLGVSAMKPTFSPDGKHLAALNTADKEHGTLYLLRPDGKVEAKREVDSPVFCEMAWDPSGSHFYFCSDDKTVSRVSRTDLSHEVLYRTEAKNEKVVSLHPARDGQGLYVTLLVEPNSSKLLRVDTRSGKVREIAAPGMEGIAASPDGKWLFLGSKRIVSLPGLEPLEIELTGPFAPPAIPDTPLGGTAAGHDFRADEAVYEEGELKIEASKPGSSMFDAIVKISVRGVEMGGIPEGKTYTTSTAKDVGTWKTTVFLTWPTGNGSDGTWLEDYDLHIIFGKEAEPGKLPVKLQLESKDPEVRITGSFVADIKGFRIIDGKPDLMADSINTLRYITKAYLEEMHPGKKLEVTWELWTHVDWGEVIKEYKVDGGKKQFLKFQCVKDSKGWKVLRTLKPYELFKAHPVTPPADSVEQAGLLVARTIEEEFARGGKNVLVSQLFIHNLYALKEKSRLTKVEVEYMVTEERKPVTVKRNFLLKWAGDAWAIEGEAAQE